MQPEEHFHSPEPTASSRPTRRDILFVTVIVLTALLDIMLIFRMAHEPALILAVGMLILVLVGMVCLLYSLLE